MLVRRRLIMTALGRKHPISSQRCNQWWPDVFFAVVSTPRWNDREKYLSEQ